MTHTQSEDNMTSGWKTVKLGEIADFANGKKRPIKKGGIPVYGGNGILDYTNQSNINGGIIIGRVGAYCGNVYIEKRPCWVSDNAIKATCKDNADTYFVYYCMKTLKLNERRIGTSQPLLTQNILNNIAVSLPPLDVQRRIAAVLRPLDDKIELNARINARLERVAQALFKRQFVRFEPYGGTMPPVWRVCRADEYFDITIGKTPPRKEPQWFSEEKGNTTWISISDMGKSGAYISDSSEYLTPEAVERFNVCIVPDNTVILSFKLTVGRVAITDGTMTTNEAIAHFKTDKPEINEYLYLYLKSFRYETLGSTSSIATAVNSKIIKAMPFIVPSDEVIKAFHETVSPMFNMIKHNLRQSRTLARLRDVLLPRLMSGAVDVRQVRLNAMQEGGSR